MVGDVTAQLGSLFPKFNCGWVKGVQMSINCGLWLKEALIVAPSVALSWY